MTRLQQRIAYLVHAGEPLPRIASLLAPTYGVTLRQVRSEIDRMRQALPQFQGPARARIIQYWATRRAE